MIIVVVINICGFAAVTAGSMRFWKLLGLKMILMTA